MQTQTHAPTTKLGHSSVSRGNFARHAAYLSRTVLRHLFNGSLIVLSPAGAAAPACMSTSETAFEGAPASTSETAFDGAPASTSETAFDGDAGLAAALFPPTVPYLYSASVPLSSLVSGPGAEALHKASVCGLTLSRADSGAVVAVACGETVLLRADDDDYTVLGVQGPKAAFPKTTSRAPAGYRLLTLPLEPGSSKSPGASERVLWALGPDRVAPVGFVAAPRAELDPLGCMLWDGYAKSAAQVAAATGLDVVDAPVEVSRLVVPELMDLRDKDAEPEDVWEWLAGLALGLEHVEGSRSSSSSSGGGSGGVGVDRVCVQGFVDANVTWGAVQRAVAAMASSGAAWVAFVVHGFEDAPVSWGSCQHGFGLCGDNHYTLVVFADGEFVLFTGLGDQDAFTR